MNIFYYLGACVPFLAFLFSCAALFDIKASRNAILWGALCTLALILALHIPLLGCASLKQIITLLPLTVDVPFIICLLSRKISGRLALGRSTKRYMVRLYVRDITIIGISVTAQMANTAIYIPIVPFVSAKMVTTAAGSTTGSKIPIKIIPERIKRSGRRLK